MVIIKFHAYVIQTNNPILSKTGQYSWILGSGSSVQDATITNGINLFGLAGVEDG